MIHTPSSNAQWVQINGLFAGPVTSLVVSGNSLFAGIDGGGVFLSTNNGTTWTPANSGLPDAYVNCLTVTGTNLLAGTDTGVFLSTNNGTSWTATGLTNNDVNAFAVSGTNLFAAAYPGGVFLSTNNGTSWTALGLKDSLVIALAVSPNGAGGKNLFAGGIGVFLSTNNGTSWTALGFRDHVVTAMAVSGTNLFAAAYPGGIYLSTNNGASWTPSTSGLPNSNVYALAVYGTNIFAATDDGVFLSTDNGANWTQSNSGLTNPYIRSFAMSGTNLFAGSRDGDVFLSTNNGTSWTQVITGMAADVHSLIVSGTSLFAGTGSCGVFRSTNNGTTWTQTSVSRIYVDALALSGANLFAGADGGGIYLSTDNGTSWTLANTGMTDYWVLSLAVSGSNLFAGTHGGVFRSTNNGSTWTQSDLTKRWIGALTFSGASLFAGIYYGSGLVFVSTNNGASWTEVDAGISGRDMKAIVASRRYIFASGFGGVFRSGDNGTSWVTVNAGLPDGYVNALAVTPNSVGGTFLFAGADAGGVFLSTNNGTSWTAAGLPNAAIGAFAVSGTNILAGTVGEGAWRRSLSEFTSTKFVTLHPYKIPSSWGKIFVAGAVERFGNIWLYGDAGVARTNGTVVDSWTLKSNGFAPGEGINGLEFIDANTIFAAGYSGRIYKTTNSGDSWSISFYDTTVTKFINKIKFFDARHGAACGDGITQSSKMAFLETTDGGSSWKNNNSYLTGSAHNSWVEFCPPSSAYLKGSYRIGTKTYQGIWRSTDLGVIWKWLPVGAGGSADSLTAASCLGFQSALKGLVARSDSTVWGTTDGGTTWRLLGETSGNLRDISFIDGTKYTIGVGSEPGLIMKIDPDAGILNWQIEEGCPLWSSHFSSETAGYFTIESLSDIFYATSVLVTDVAVAKYLPPTFRLVQNYPNPFNPGTTIRYELPEAANVSLTIFNILGQVVATLVDEKKEAGGYQVQWNASTAPSGIYFCRLRAGAHTETQKMVVAK